MSQKSYDGKNCVYVIPTPVGNMKDLTPRAIETLEMVDVIFCEDTRVTGQLLKNLNISKKMICSNEQSETNKITDVILYLNEGKNVGIVTDRGTPLISDPGYNIVQAVSEKGYNVVTLPGATALIPALVNSGLSPLPFLFYGFLNSKSSKRKKELENLKGLKYTLIFYEAPHRIIDTLEDILLIFGNRNISISREISKIHEEIYRGTIKNVIEELNSQKIQGEFVIVVDKNNDEIKYEDLTIKEHVEMYMEDGFDEKESMKKVAKDRGMSKSDIYKEYHLRGE